MFIAIVQHAPRWVWFVLAALLGLGASQLFSRRISVQRATLLPIALAAVSSYGVVTTFAQAWLAFAAWATGIAAALALTMVLRVWRGVIWSARDERLVVPGSWVPMLLIVARFAVKFGVGASLALGPWLARDPGFAAAVGLTYGWFSGMFLGRGLVMWQVARQGLQTTSKVWLRPEAAAMAAALTGGIATVATRPSVRRRACMFRSSRATMPVWCAGNDGT